MTIIAIVGPTATGKTERAVALAHALNAPILSSDSRLVYTGMDIGTAKPTHEARQGVPHYLIDLVTPTETFTVAEYVRQAKPLLQSFLATNSHVLVVGGTGLYFKALLQGGYMAPVPPDPIFRATRENTPTAELFDELRQKDARRAAQLYPTDRVRIIRALEIIHHTGQPVPEAQPETATPGVVWLGLTWQNRDRHRQVIADRVKAMMDIGWLEEVRHLLGTYGETAHALSVTHGYPEWMAYLQGRMTYEDAMASTTLQVQQYARRQRTWFTRNPFIQWSDVEHLSLDQWLSQVLQQL